MCPWGTAYCVGPDRNASWDTTDSWYGGYLLPGAPAWGLVGRVGNGQWVHVGSGPTTLSGTGELAFAANDDLFPDNTDNFVVTVSFSAGPAGGAATTSIRVAARLAARRNPSKTGHSLPGRPRGQLADQLQNPSRVRPPSVSHTLIRPLGVLMAGVDVRTGERSSCVATFGEIRGQHRDSSTVCAFLAFPTHLTHNRWHHSFSGSRRSA